MTVSRMKLIVVTLVLSLAIVSITSAKVVRETQRGANWLIEAKEAEAQLHRVLLDRTNSDLVKAKADLEVKSRELAATSASLAQKLAELDAANRKIKSQQAQISANASELQKLRDRPPLFSFKVEATNLADAQAKKAAIEKLVTDAYDTIVDVYGKPYLLHSVTISLVDALSNPNAGAETEIVNGPQGLSITIRLTDFNANEFNDVNGMIHELIHTFHGLSVLSPVAFEEGITVAAADVVMERLIAAGKIAKFNPLYIRISSSQYHASARLPSNDNQFYSSPSVADYYQTAGYGWRELYRSKSSFFGEFNEKIYTQKRDGNEITPAVVRDAVMSVVSSVAGQSVVSWMNTPAFNLL